MFRLLRYYSITSAVAVVAVTVVLVAFFRHHELAQLVESAESQNVVLAKSFANTIWPRFSSYVGSVSDVDGDTLRARPETQQIHEVLVTLVTGLPVLKVKIYTLDGLTVYSSEPSQIGADKSNNLGFMASAREGRPASKLSFRNRFSTFFGEVEDRHVVESYLPIRRNDGAAEGVFELYTDVTPLVRRIDRKITKVTIGLLLILTFLYGVLALIVWRADRLLRRQYGELEQQVTDRKRAEEALRAAKEENEMILNAAGEGIYGLDMEGRTTFINPAAARMIGWQPEELIGEPQHAILHHTKPDGSPYPKEECPIYAAFRDGTAHHVSDEVFWRKDGISFPVEYTSTPIRNDSGEPTGAVVVFKDITERKRAEGARRESEERFKNFAELASDWFWEMDENVRFSYFSESSTPEGRINLDALLGKTRKEWAAPHEDSELWTSHLDTLAARKPFRGFTYARLDDHGTEMNIRVNGSPVFDADGKFLGYRGTGSDVTAEVEALQALRAARDEAQQANAAKSEFLANMSHELRTPLNAVVGFSELMKQETLGALGNPKYLEYTKDIHDAGNHLLELINDILDLSKVEAGEEELKEDVLDIDELLESVRKLVSGRADRGGVTLAFDVAEALPGLRADQRKLKQVLVNLMSNAIKFTDAGGRVTFRAWYGDGGMVFQVVDTGIGIAAENIPIALAPFRQVEHGLARKYQGTGLGLPLAKSLVEMHGGSLDLQSEPGVGTTATVRLPASRVVVVAAAAQRKRAG